MSPLRGTLLAGATMALLLPVAPAAADDGHGPGPFGNPYAEPLDALDGRTLAEHLADLRWDDPRLRRTR